MDQASTIIIQPLAPGRRAWARQVLTARWGSAWIATRGRLVDAGQLPGFVAVEGEGRGGEGPLGLATYRIEAGECELVTLDSLLESRGAGTALLEAVREEAVRAGCGRLWLVTTNANLHALGFHQRRGLRLAAVHRGALEASRRLKPTIPLEEGGVPLRDEIELELILPSAGTAGRAVEPPVAGGIPTNIEIKARARDPAELARRAEALAGGPPIVLEQEDTFFVAPKGRLKLRVLGPGGRDGAELIQYDRPDVPGPRPSRYVVAPVGEPVPLRRALSRALGEAGTVRKRRRLFLHGRTRIHLDEVEELGSFLELEVVLSLGDTEQDGHAEARRLMELLGVAEADLIASPYLDLLAPRPSPDPSGSLPEMS